MSDEQKTIQQLAHALGLAIGALETINLCQDDFSRSGVENVLERIKAISELQLYRHDALARVQALVKGRA